MKIMLIVASALVAASAFGCAANTAPVSSSRDAYLEQRAKIAAVQPVDCAETGDCTVLVHEDPEQRVETSTKGVSYPLAQPKPKGLSYLLAE